MPQRCRIAYNRHAPHEKAADIGLAGIRLRSIEVAECYRERISKNFAKEETGMRI
jgi:hypothetical protein